MSGLDPAKILVCVRHSFGRAPGSQSGGQGFDPPMVHQMSIGRTPTFSAAVSPSDVFSDTKPERRFSVRAEAAFFCLLGLF